MAKQPTGKRSTSKAVKPVSRALRARRAFGSAANAERAAAALYKRTPPERIIKLLTVQEILVEEHVQKM